MPFNLTQHLSIDVCIVSIYHVPAVDLLSLDLLSLSFSHDDKVNLKFQNMYYSLNTWILSTSWILQYPLILKLLMDVILLKLLKSWTP